MNFEPRMGRIDTDKKMAEKRRAMLGQAKLALCFQIPSQASLHGILKAQRSLCCANGPALSPRSEIFGRKCRVAIGLQAGMCCEKHLQARLRVSFPQQIQHSHSESTRATTLYQPLFTRYFF
jgi:hypothetical protein